MRLITNIIMDIPRIGSALQFELWLFFTLYDRKWQRFWKKTAALNSESPGTRVEPAPNSEYAPISEMRQITCNYGILMCFTLKPKENIQKYQGLN